MPPAKWRSRFRWSWAVVLLLAVVLGLGVNRLRYDVRSYALLVHFLDPQAGGPLLNIETRSITVEELSIPSPNGPIRARMYLPAGVAHPPGLLNVHGIHHLGIDEPRLINFSRAAAESGLAVLTPEITAFADYHVDADSIATIGESAIWLDQRLGGRGVTVSGVSFAGGLAALAARDPRYAPHMRTLVLMGAYEDLARVSRFLATSVEEFPNGREVPFAAHDYGASVFVYAHLDQFFPPADRAVAHEALRYWLWEHPEKATPLLEHLSPASRTLLQALMDRRIDAVRPQLLRAIEQDRDSLAALSPHGQIAGLRVPVFILHGAEDNVIPAAESLWLKREVPRAMLRDVLITKAFSHVDPKQGAATWDQLLLVHFLGAVLRDAN